MLPHSSTKCNKKRKRSRCRGTTETICGDLLQADVIERIRTACDDGDLDLAILNAGTAHYENAGVFKAETFNVLIQSNLVTMVSCVCPGFIKTPLTDQNRFKMPFLMDCEAAAEVILNGLQSQRHEIHFPKRLSLLLKFVMSLPASWQYRLLLRTTRSLSL